MKKLLMIIVALSVLLCNCGSKKGSATLATSNKSVIEVKGIEVREFTR